MHSDVVGANSVVCATGMRVQGGRGREEQAKLLATSGPYQGLGLALVKTDAPTTEFIPTPVGEGLVSPVYDRFALASPWRRNHGICTNNVRMQTKRLLLGMVGRKRPVSAQLTDEVAHKPFALAPYTAPTAG